MHFRPAFRQGQCPAPFVVVQDPKVQGQHGGSLRLAFLGQGDVEVVSTSEDEIANDEFSSRCAVLLLRGGLRAPGFF